MKWSKLFLLAVMTAIFFACEETTLPKPMGYYRIDLPPQSYVRWSDADCPYSFQISKAAKIQPSKKGKECHFDLVYEQYNATIYFSYLTVKNDLKALVDQEYAMREKHNAFRCQGDQSSHSFTVFCYG